MLNSETVLLTHKNSILESERDLSGTHSNLISTIKQDNNSQDEIEDNSMASTRFQLFLLKTLANNNSQRRLDTRRPNLVSQETTGHESN